MKDKKPSQTLIDSGLFNWYYQKHNASLGPTYDEPNEIKIDADTAHVILEKIGLQIVKIWDNSYSLGFIRESDNVFWGIEYYLQGETLSELHQSSLAWCIENKLEELKEAINSTQ